MANILLNNNPLSGLSKRVDRLENTLKELGRKVSRDRKVVQDGHFHYVLGKVMNLNRLMAELVERLKGHRKRSGRIDTDIADDLNRAKCPITMAMARNAVDRRCLGILRRLEAFISKIDADGFRTITSYARVEPPSDQETRCAAVTSPRGTCGTRHDVPILD